ncbi:MAG TPA: rRNA maturation RNase YbeY [Dehalococcoidia bacterium]|nr:rRNA maturation RNase YbeY [Dehalococcoidia bacterium]|tara:strand:+ start:1432 stop:2010 length:579 start_codon:yes stop_codon:yes gene_type:complete
MNHRRAWMPDSPHSLQEIDISVDEPYQQELSEVWLRTVMEAALVEALPQGEPAQVGLMVTDDKTVQELNRQFRGLDEVTDVLSFSASHSGHWEGDPQESDEASPESVDSEELNFVLPPGEPSPLGEVIISFPQTIRQAQERNGPVEQELALLIIHGVLHLVGYDHMEPEDEAQMQAKERSALAAVSQLEAGI